jgi:membrane protease subunit HflK
MYIETMQQILSSTSKVMIDTKNGTNQVYLPLDRLLAQSTANEAARGAGSGPVMAPPQNPAQPAQQAQPQATQQQPQSSAATQPDNASGESARTRELRSRDTGRERESR